jgi:hypothetical protein
MKQTVYHIDLTVLFAGSAPNSVKLNKNQWLKNGPYPPLEGHGDAGV